MAEPFEFVHFEQRGLQLALLEGKAFSYKDVLPERNWEQSKDIETAALEMLLERMCDPVLRLSLDDKLMRERIQLASLDPVDKVLVECCNLFDG